MKNEDLSFKLLAVIIVAGLVAACLPSAHAALEKQCTHSGVFSTSGGTASPGIGFSGESTLAGPNGETTERGTATQLDGDGFVTCTNL